MPNNNNNRTGMSATQHASQYVPTRHGEVNNKKHMPLLLAMDEICWWFPNMSPTTQQFVLDIITFYYDDVLRQARYIYPLSTWQRAMLSYWVVKNKLSTSTPLHRQLPYVQRRYAHLRHRYLAIPENGYTPRRIGWTSTDLRHMLACYCATAEPEWLAAIEWVKSAPYRTFKIRRHVRIEASRILHACRRREQLDPRSTMRGIPPHVHRQISQLKM